jgi:hypothetical protein
MEYLLSIVCMINTGVAYDLETPGRVWILNEVASYDAVCAWHKRLGHAFLLLETCN